MAQSYDIASTRAFLCVDDFFFLLSGLGGPGNGTAACAWKGEAAIRTDPLELYDYPPRPWPDPEIDGPS